MATYRTSVIGSSKGMQVLSTDQLMQLRRLVSGKSHLSTEELNTAAKVVNLSYADCCAWYQQCGITVPLKTSKGIQLAKEEVSHKLGFAILSKIGTTSIPEKRARVFMASQKRSLFCNLPYEKQVYMLRKTENMTIASLQLAQEIATKLNLPVEKVRAWLKSRRKRMIKMKADSSMKISTVKLALLNAEFSYNKEIDDDKILVLSFLFNLPKKLIQNWYRKRLAQNRFREKQVATKTTIIENRSKLKVLNLENLPATRAQSSTSKSLYGNQKKTPKQLTILFEAYKKHSGKLNEHVNQLMLQTGLTESSIRCWIAKLNRVLKTKTVSTVSNNLRHELLTSQVCELQKEYQKCKYITRNEANKIASSISLTAGKVMRWFGNRRLFELFSKHPLGNSYSCETPEEENMKKQAKSVSKGVVIQKTLVKRHNYGIPAFKVLRLMKDCRRFGNKKTFSKLGKELGLHDKQITSWVKNQKYRNEMINRAKLVYGEALNENIGHSKKPLLNEKTDSNKEIQANTLQAPESTSKPTTSTQYNLLFNAYRESPTLSDVRCQELSTRLNLDKMKISNYWSNMRKHVRNKSTEKLRRFLQDSCNDDQREKLIKAYSKMRYYSQDYLTRLANQIGFGTKTIQVWFLYARLYELKTGTKFKSLPSKPTAENLQSTNLAWPEIQKLKLEFQKDAIMTEMRAQLLATKLKIHADKIKEWFHSRQTLVTENGEKEMNNDTDMVYKVIVEEKEDDTEQKENEIRAVSICLPKISPSTSSTNTTTIVGKTEGKLPFQNEVLFKEFLQGPELSSARLQHLASTLHLSKQHICKWFSWLQTKVANLSNEILIDAYRNKNLTSKQVDTLESVYKVKPYPDEEEKEQLAEQLGVTRSIVKMWFANRRYYEILMSEKTSFLKPGGTDFKPVITSISSSRPVSNQFCGPSNLLSVDNSTDEILNSYDFSPLDLDQIDILFPNELVPERVEFISCIRHVEPLNESLQPIMSKSLDQLFWYVSNNPGKQNKNCATLSEADIVVLEGLYKKNPRPVLSEICSFAQRLVVSEQTVYWWFIQQRNFQKIKDTAEEESTYKVTERRIVNDGSQDNNIVEDVLSTDLSEAKYPATNHSPLENIEVQNAIEVAIPHQRINGSSTLTQPSLSKRSFTLSSHQRAILLQEFRKSHFVNKLKARAIAADIGLASKIVESWFQKQRQKLGIAEPNALESVIKTLNPNQMVALELEYRTNPSLTRERLNQLSTKLDVSHKSILIWFKGRKQKAAEVCMP